MPLSKAQIDARLALQCRGSPRGRRAVTAPNEALSYRYGSQQFFSLDVLTFTDLFASLTGQQLSRVAKAPEVIKARSDSSSTFDDFWPRLYQEGRKDKPIWAALYLVGMLKSEFHVEKAPLTRAEAAYHALTKALQAQAQPPLEVIDAYGDHVRWLKNELCKSAPAAVRPDPTNTQTSRVAHRNHGHPRKRRLVGTDDRDVVHPEKPADLVQCEHYGESYKASGLAFPQQSAGHIMPTEMTETDTASFCPAAPSLGSAPTLDVVKLATSRTFASSIDLDLTVFRPFEAEVSGWMPTCVSHPTLQPTEMNNLASAARPRADSKQLSWPAQSDPEMYTRSIVAPPGTTITTSPVTWTELPRVNSTSPPDISRTFEVPSPQL